MNDQVMCQHHPDRPAAALCQKYGKGLCVECLEQQPRCSDPSLYCKFRPQCIISFEEKEQNRQARQAGASR